ncbi:MAG: TIGR03960 family B12-binding radical SAM protein [Deltaproteobacteria bacterium]|nr:TIGR03960 family B12-binding radical SAM protein [Deltaproteobacteria bacterium]
MQSYRAAYESLLGRVTKPGRYLGGEYGMVQKDLRTVRLRFALAFPDVYEIAQSHPGLQILYDILNRRPDVFAERVYAPWLDMEAELRAAGLPLVALETFTPLDQFDIVGFTLQYELTYTNLLAMLDLGKVALHSRDRRADAPLVIAGGPCAFNVEPLADFLDAVLLGDGEEAVHDICDAYLAWDRRDRHDLLAKLASIRGVYVPSFFKPEHAPNGRIIAVHPSTPGNGMVEKRILRDLNSVPTQETFVVPSVQIVHDRPSLEVMRGCVKGCRFCQAGYIYRPLRERAPDRVLANAERALQETGHDEVSLLSLSTGDYSCINPVLTELMNRLAPSRVAVSLPSTRVDALAPSLLDQIRRVRKTGFTLAPEAGSQRMRDIIQKEYQESELISAAKQIFALGWRNLKLYFMIGLPSETDEDLMGIVDLASKVAATGNRQCEVTASVSNFVPKPHTPFQWAVQVPIEEIERRQRFLRQELGKRRIKFRYHDARLSMLEGVFSRGDRRTAAALQRAFELGCRFDGWNEECRFDLWEQAFAETDLSVDFYLRRRTLDEPLPWDHLSSGVTKEFLQRELALAFERTLTPDCSVERCTYCGACDFKEVRNVDYHLYGAKAAEHRGELVDHWASDIVAEKAEGAWEPRGWQKVHGGLEAATHGADLPSGATATGEKDAASGRSPDADNSDQPHGLGNAEEWLSAGGESTVHSVRSPAPSACCRVTLQYHKLALARFIGNLELSSVFHRAARRAQLPVAFSQGHHPLPRFAFGPALPLGTESESEFVEIDLTHEMPPAEIADRLNAQLPQGLRVVSAIDRPLKGASVAGLINGFRYQIDLSSTAEMRPAHVEARLAEFMAASSFPLQKHAKGGNRVIDARPFVANLKFDSAVMIDATIRFDKHGTLKPADLIAAILDLNDRDRSALRIRKVFTTFASSSDDHSVAIENFMQP